MTTRPALFVVCALSLAWITSSAVYLYPGVKEEVGTPAVMGLALVTWTRRRKRLSPSEPRYHLPLRAGCFAGSRFAASRSVASFASRRAFSRAVFLSRARA